MMQRHMPLGYGIKNGKAVIVPETAAIVRQVFQDYISGISTYRIAKELTKKGVPNASHKPSWNHGSIGKILENRKYLGDGFYPPMIEGDLFEQVQKRRMEKQVQLGRTIQPNSFANRNVFAGKLRCGKCGQPYRRYVEHCNQPGEKVNWKCKRYIHGNRVYCRNLFLTDEQIADAFLKAVNRIIVSPKLLERRKGQEPEIGRAADEKLSAQIGEMLEIGTAPAQEIKALIFERAKLQYQRSKINDYEYQTDKIKRAMAGIGEQSEFDDALFEQTIRQAVIQEDGKITFQLHNGIEIDTYVKK